MNFKYCKVSDDQVDDALASQREGAFPDDSRISLGNVFHKHNDAGHAGDQVHGASHAFEDFTWDHEVGKVAVGGDLEGAEHGDVDMAAADHGEGFRAVEGGCSRDHGYGFFASVYDVAAFV